MTVQGARREEPGAHLVFHPAYALPRVHPDVQITRIHSLAREPESDAPPPFFLRRPLCTRASTSSKALYIFRAFLMIIVDGSTFSLCLVAQVWQGEVCPVV